MAEPRLRGVQAIRSVVLGGSPLVEVRAADAGARHAGRVLQRAAEVEERVVCVGRRRDALAQAALQPAEQRVEARGVADGAARRRRPPPLPAVLEEAKGAEELGLSSIQLKQAQTSSNQLYFW